jgi:hypothetical protein
VLGNQFVLLWGAQRGRVWRSSSWGSTFWLALTYAMLPGLMEGAVKPKPESGLNGAWCSSFVGTQAVSVLACLLAPALAVHSPDLLLFAGLGVLARRQHVVHLADRADLPSHPVPPAAAGRS